MAVLAVFFKRLRLLDFSRTCQDLAVSTGTTVGTLGSRRGLVLVGPSAEPSAKSSTVGAVVVVLIGGSTPFGIARGAEVLATSAEGLATGAKGLATYTESVATGAESLATGAESLATGTESLAVLEAFTPSGAKPGAGALLGGFTPSRAKPGAGILL